MKSLAKILCGVIAVILFAMIIVPIFFKDKITLLVKSEINELVDAKVDFKDVNISLFRAFPHVSININDFVIEGNSCFEGDTLISTSYISATVNLMSIIRSENIEITEIIIEKPVINAKLNCEGIPNWDIVKDTEEIEIEEETEENSNEKSFNLSLNKFIIKSCNISYFDCMTNQKFEMKELSLFLSGALNEEETILKSEIEIDKINAFIDNVKYVSDLKVLAKLDINANLKDKIFILGTNSVSINDIKTSIEGWVDMSDSEKTKLDLKMNTNNISFKEILSLIPSIYANDYNKLNASGDIKLNGWIRGEIYEDILPAFDLSLKANNGRIGYENISTSIDNINIDIRAFSEGGNVDKITTQIEKFHFSILENSFDMNAIFSNMVSDWNYKIKAKGTIDLTKISEVIPSQEIKELKGVVTADLNINGSMSEIEKELYENMKASGSLRISDLSLENNDIGKITINEANLVFTPKYVELKNLNILINSSLLNFSGKVENFISYVVKGGTIKGILNVNSNKVLLSDFMTKVETNNSEEDNIEESTGVIIIPENVEFRLNLNVSEVLIDNVVLTDLSGIMTLKQSVADISSLKMNAFDGNINMNGRYSTLKDEKPEAGFDLNIVNASFKKSFESVESLQKIAPVFKNMTGNYSMKLNLKTQILPDFAPDLNSLLAKGNLKSNNVSISGVEAIDKISELLKYEQLKNISVNDANVSFEIENGKLIINPFDIKTGSTTIALSGYTGLNQTLDLKGKISIPSDKVKIMNMSINNLPFTIKGTFSKPDVSLDTKALTSDLSNKATEKVKDLLADKLGLKNDSIKSGINDITEKKKTELLEEAKKQADALVKEAEKQGDKLIEMAGDNKLKKLGAEKAAEKLKKEAQKKAAEIINKIENQ